MTRRFTMPTVTPDGDMLPLLSRRDKEKFALAVLKESGGFDRLVDVLKKDDDKFFEWAKEATVKRLPKYVEHDVSEGVEALLEKLDAGVHADIIDAVAAAKSDK